MTRRQRKVRRVPPSEQTRWTQGCLALQWNSGAFILADARVGLVVVIVDAFPVWRRVAQFTGAFFDVGPNSPLLGDGNRSDGIRIDSYRDAAFSAPRNGW